MSYILKVTNISDIVLEITDDDIKDYVSVSKLRPSDNIELPTSFRTNNQISSWLGNNLVESRVIASDDTPTPSIQSRFNVMASEVGVLPNTDPFIQHTNAQSFLNKVETLLSSSIEGTVITKDVSLSSESYKDFDIARSGAAWIIRGRMFISSDPGAAFSQTPELIIYSGPDRKDEEMIYKSTVQLTYTEFSSGATAGDGTITIDDTSDFFADDLLYLFSAADNEFGRIESIDSATVLSMIDNIDNDYSVDDGVSNVVEFGNLALIDTADDEKLYFRISFGSSQTLSLRTSLTVTSMISG